VENALRLENEDQPLLIVQDKEKCGKDSLTEEVSSGDNVQWNQNGDDVVKANRMIQDVKNEHINLCFGPGRHGVRLRTLRRFKGGNLDLRPFQWEQQS
jgi:hypothetical protein